MGDIAVGSEYLPIIRYHCINKVHSKVDDRVDEHYKPGIIDRCAVSG